MIIFLILLLILIIYLLYKMSILKEELKEKVEIDVEIERDNRELSAQREQLRNQIITLSKEIDLKSIEWDNLNNNLRNSKDIIQESFDNYILILEKNYKEKELEYSNLLKNLENEYDNAQDEKINKINNIQNELQKIQDTRAAAIEASRKEKEIKENREFYCLKTTDADLSDIKILSKIKSQLNQPRILSMLIWQTYYQKPMTQLCNNILGADVRTGIYKITNQIDDYCYIGQAVDVSKRWKEHAKCGLGIDTPAANKLYKAIQEYGIWNFSWELLEECPKDQLNEKERFYINLYQAYEFGYNSNKGVN